MFTNNEMPIQNILIAVMGATGTGKSTLIQTLTGDENIHIGHGQESQTDQVRVSTYFDPDNNCNVTLVDTPGFDDSRDGITDTDILLKIVNLLQQNGGQRLTGLIYVHRISDPRMGAISKRNLRMFKQLCGDGVLKNVCIATTNWDRVTEEEGNMRERELRESPNLFKPLISEGAQLARHDKSIASARSIIDYLIHKDPTKLQIQVELDEGKRLEETEAGSVLKEEIKALVEKLEAELLTLKEEMKEAGRGRHAELLAELEEERQKGEAQRKKMQEDLENLKLQAQSDKAEHETKVRGLEDEMTKRLLAELKQNNREHLELMKQQAQRDNDEQEGKMRSLEADVKRREAELRVERNAREEMERNNRERIELLKQQARHDKDEHEKKIHILEDKLAAEAKKREATLLAEREVREEMERYNRERLEVLKHEHEAKIRGLEDKMAADAKKQEAALLAEHKAREELKRSNQKSLDMLKQQVQNDKDEHEVKMRSLEDKMAVDVKKRKAELLAERKAREELDRNNRECLESLKQQMQNDKDQHETDLLMLNKKLEAEARAREADNKALAEQGWGSTITSIFWGILDHYYPSPQ